MSEADKNAETIKTNLAIVDEVGIALAALSEEYDNLPAINIDTDEGYEEAKARKKPLTNLRTKCEGARKNAGRVLLDEKKRIDDTAKRILAGIAMHEQPLIDGIKAADDEKARIAQEAAEKEQARIDGIEKGMRIINDRLQAVSREQVETSIAMLNDTSFEDFDEFEQQAREKVSSVIGTLTERLEEIKALEQENRRITKIAEEQAEQQRKLDEQAAAQRAEQDRIASEQKAAQDKIDRQQREIENQKREAELKAQAEKDKADALAKAEKEKEVAVKAAKLKAAEDERLRVEAEKQREADEKAERERIAAMAPDAEKLRTWFDAIGALPSMNSGDGADTLSAICKSLAGISDMITALEDQVENKAE